MAYINTDNLFKCETCRRYRGGKCLAWCESYECYSPNMKKIPTVDVAEVVRCKAKDLSTIQRMLGIIEGAAYNSIAMNTICDAVATIDEVLDKFEMVERSEHGTEEL